MVRNYGSKKLQRASGQPVVSSMSSENTPNHILIVKVKRADLAGQLGWGSVGTLPVAQAQCPLLWRFWQQWLRLPGGVR